MSDQLVAEISTRQHTTIITVNPPGGFKPKISASKRPQIHTLDHAAAGTGTDYSICVIYTILWYCIWRLFHNTLFANLREVFHTYFSKHAPLTWRNYRQWISNYQLCYCFSCIYFWTAKRYKKIAIIKSTLLRTVVFWGDLMTRR